VEALVVAAVDKDKEEEGSSRAVAAASLTGDVVVAAPTGAEAVRPLHEQV